jgi:hypothetical protein
MNLMNTRVLAMIAIIVATVSLITAGIGATDVFAKKNNDNGADVQKGFQCNVFDENGNLESTSNSHSVVTPSGNSNLHCKGEK